jgi:hypothetical protein
VVLFQPLGDAVGVECVIAAAESDSTSLVGLVFLAVDATLHARETADGALVDLHVPVPGGDAVPLLNLRGRESETRRGGRWEGGRGKNSRVVL